MIGERGAARDEAADRTTLLVLHDRAARRQRVRALRALMRATGGEVGGHYRVAVVAGEIVVVESLVIGDDALAARLRAFHGRLLPVGSAGRVDDASRLARRGGWSLDAAPVAVRRGFRAVADDFPCRAAFERLAVFRDVYAPHDLFDHLRCLPFWEGKSLGWLGVWRRGRGGGFTGADKERANRLLEGATRALAVGQMQQALDEGAVAVLDEAGRVERACPRARPWLCRARSQRMRRLAGEAQRGGPTMGFIDDVLVRLLPVSGDGGSGYVAELLVGAPVVLRPGPALTIVEGDVAAAAAAGLSVREIAEERSVSVNTVKFHLKAAYEKLGVSNRVELARALASSTRSGAYRFE